MTIEVTGYAFIDGELHLYATDCDDRHLQNIERNRYDDGSEKELEFVFAKKDLDYLYKWLKRQKAVQTASPRKLGDAIKATLGIVTTISGKYLELV